MRTGVDRLLREARTLLRKSRVADGVTDLTTITVTLRDPERSLVKFLEALRSCANPGHSFPVVMDPDDPDTETFFFDGDGSFFIDEIKEG